MFLYKSRRHIGKQIYCIAVVNFTPRLLYPRKELLPNGSWMDPGAGLGDLEKIQIFLPLPAFEPRIVQPVASHNTD